MPGSFMDAILLAAAVHASVAQRIVGLYGDQSQDFCMRVHDAMDRSLA